MTFFTQISTAQDSIIEPPAAQVLIEQLNMQYLPIESGYFALREGSNNSVATDIVKESVDEENVSRAIHSSIYYLLTASKPTNYLHWLDSDDVHILVDGGPLDYYLFLENGEVKHFRLGNNLAAGEHFAITVPARSYKAIRLAKGATHGLMVNVLTPAWSENGVRMGADKTFFEKYIGKAEWATSEFLESLIPPEGH